MRLKVRLTLAFLAVAALGALLSFFLVQRSSEALFRSFVFSGDSAKASVYAGLLGEYYRNEGSWKDAQRFVEDLPNLFTDMVNVKTHYESTRFRDLFSDRVVIVDDDEPPDRTRHARTSSLIARFRLHLIMSSECPPRFDAYNGTGSPRRCGDRLLGRSRSRRFQSG